MAHIFFWAIFINVMYPPIFKSLLDGTEISRGFVVSISSLGRIICRGLIFGKDTDLHHRHCQLAGIISAHPLIQANWVLALYSPASWLWFEPLEILGRWMVPNSFFYDERCSQVQWSALMQILVAWNALLWDLIQSFWLIYGPMCKKAYWEYLLKYSVVMEGRISRDSKQKQNIPRSKLFDEQNDSTWFESIVLPSR